MKTLNLTEVRLTGNKSTLNSAAAKERPRALKYLRQLKYFVRYVSVFFLGNCLFF